MGKEARAIMHSVRRTQHKFGEPTEGTGRFGRQANESNTVSTSGNNARAFINLGRRRAIREPTTRAGGAHGIVRCPWAEVHTYVLLLRVLGTMHDARRRLVRAKASRC